MNNKLAGLMFPAFTILTLSVLSFLGLFGEGDVNKSFFIFGLYLIFPFAFLVQGIACAINHINPFIALLISYISFGVIILSFFHYFAWGLSLYYLIAWLIGYFGIWMVRKRKETKNAKAQ